MKTITTRELRENMKTTFVTADQEQEVFIVPSTGDRDDIFIVPGRLYNQMAARNQPMSIDQVNAYMDIIDKEDSKLMQRLAE